MTASHFSIDITTGIVHVELTAEIPITPCALLALGINAHVQPVTRMGVQQIRSTLVTE